MKPKVLIYPLTLLVSLLAGSCDERNYYDVTPQLSVTPAEKSVGAWSQDILVTINSNAPWEIVEAPDELSIVPTSGNSGSQIKISVPENELIPRSFQVKFKLTDDPKKTTTLTLKQDVLELIYQDVQYSIARLKDNRIWMCENLRYIPEGKTPSDSPSDQNGIWYPGGPDRTPKTHADSVKKYGYLYDAATAFCVDTILEANYQTFEGTRGICPEGWHIPTLDECNKLVEAYYDETQKGAPIAELNKDGFSYILSGTVLRGNNQAVGNWNISCMMLSSSGRKHTVNATSQAVTCQNDILMWTNTASYQRVTVALGSVYAGLSVRCIKD